MSIHQLLVASLLVFAFSPASQATTWKSVFISGDDSVENFDQGRRDLTEAFARKGTMSISAQLSSSDTYIGKDGVEIADARQIIMAFKNLNVAQDEGCLIHMTSHGTEGKGFFLARSNSNLTPRTFATLVKRSCGEAPTVILVSACYSGQFITEDLKGPNRIILTAARSDRTSFGCSADTKYTYWDGCLLQEIPRSQTWAELHANVKSCISQKEALTSEIPSEPQAYFGAQTSNWSIMGGHQHLVLSTSKH